MAEITDLNIKLGIRWRLDKPVKSSPGAAAVLDLMKEFACCLYLDPVFASHTV